MSLPITAFKQQQKIVEFQNSANVQYCSNQCQYNSGKRKSMECLQLQSNS